MICRACFGDVRIDVGPPQNRHRAGNRRQRVSQFVREHGQEHVAAADVFPRAFFGPFALGDVAERGQIRGRPLPFRGNNPHFRHAMRAAVSQKLDLGRVARRERDSELLPDQLLRGPAQQLFGGGVGKANHPRQIDDHNAVGTAFHNPVERGVAQIERAFQVGNPGGLIAAGSAAIPTCPFRLMECPASIQALFSRVVELISR